eukprot:6054440-Ditylum_brightwellii.AAC.1
MGEGIEQLLAFSDLSQDEKDRYPHTDQLNDGSAKLLLEHQKSIMVVGFTNMKHHVLEPDNLPFNEEDESMEGVDPPTIPTNGWMLWRKALGGSKLIMPIERGPRG